MKRDDVIELARKAGFTVAGHAPIVMVDSNNWIEHIDRFAQLVEQATLERAKAAALNCKLHSGDFLRNSDPRVTIAQDIGNLAKDSQ